MEFTDLEHACTVFGLKDKASYAEIKKRHRELLRQYHPDHNADVDGEMIRRINEAYAVLEEYCANYQFNFSKEELFQQNPEARLRDQFAYDPIWGGAAQQKPQK